MVVLRGVLLGVVLLLVSCSCSPLARKGDLERVDLTLITAIVREEVAAFLLQLEEERSSWRRLGSHEGDEGRRLGSQEEEGGRSKRRMLRGLGVKGDLIPYPRTG